MFGSGCHKVVLQSLKLSSNIGGRFNPLIVLNDKFYLLVGIKMTDQNLLLCFFEIFLAGFASEQPVGNVRPSPSALQASFCPLPDLILQDVGAVDKLDDLIEHISIIFHVGSNIFQSLLYTYYMMNVRQLQLQSIIKNLQSKIITLKQQQRIINERYEGRVKEIKDQNARILAEKDKAIEYLRTEMDKDREMILYEQRTYDSCRNKERLELITQLEKYRAKCAELEKRIQASTEKYSLKNKDLQEQNLRLREVVHELSNTSQMSLQTEIDKLNKYLHTSRVQQSRRQTTTDWIDKLANFIDHFNSENDKVTKQALSFLHLGLENLKQQVINPLKTMNEQEQFFAKERKNILSKIRQIVQEQNKITQESSEENEKIWEMMRKERNNHQTEKIAALEKQLTNTTQKYQEETNMLVAKIKQLQNQRKTLLLGFTELKSLNESREKTYRDEIAALKQTIEQLLTGIQQRQTQFESQVQTLYAQLSNLNQRYYQNIQVPLHGLSGRIEVQLKAARQQIQKLTDNKGFNKLIQNLQATLQKYVQEQAVSNKLSFELTEYSRKVEALVIMGKQILQMDTERKMFLPDSPTHRAESEEKALLIQQKMKDVEYKQNENKLRYEILTLKKHNKKLKDQCNILQSQLNQRQSSALKGRQTQNRVEQNKDTIAKINELELQVQNLTKLNQGYQEEFMYQLNSVKDSIKKITGNELKENSDRYRFKEGIHHIKECNQKILEFLDRENHHIKSVRQTLASLDRIMVRPVQVFDDFIAMIGKCYVPLHSQSTRTKNENSISFPPFQKLKAVYADIVPKRQDNAVSTNRLTAELIRTLRESLPASTHKSKITAQDSQEERLQKSRVIRQNPLERKIKDLQSQKIKNREEVLRKIEKIEECLRTMDQKIGKRTIANVQRIEEIFERKLLQLSQRYMTKTFDSSSQLSQITTSALKELKLKLRNCMVQNQGLVKELQYLHILKKQSQ